MRTPCSDLLLATAALAFLVPATLPSGNGITGLTTSDFGSGCGPTLSLAWNATKGSVDATITGGSAMGMSFLLVGEQLPSPTALPSPPFGTGCSLLVGPFAAFPLLGGGSGSIVVPPIPGLVGMSFDTQGVALDFSSPMSLSLRLTQGVHATFQ